MPFNIDITKPPVRVTTHDAEAIGMVGQHTAAAAGTALALAFHHKDPYFREQMCKVVEYLLEADKAIPVESVELVAWFKDFGSEPKTRRLIRLIREGSIEAAIRLATEMAEYPLLVHVVDNTVETVKRD